MMLMALMTGNTAAETAAEMPRFQRRAWLSLIFARRCVRATEIRPSFFAAKAGVKTPTTIIAMSGSAVPCAAL